MGFWKKLNINRIELKVFEVFLHLDIYNEEEYFSVF